MKRMIVSISATVLLAALIAAPAEGAIRTLKGPVDGGGTFKLDVKIRNGEAKKAGDFLARNIPVNCDGSNTSVRFSFTGFVPINDLREFVFDFTSFTAHIDGKLNKKKKKATGEISFGPADVGEHDDCTTGGLREYEAKKK